MVILIKKLSLRNKFSSKDNFKTVRFIYLHPIHIKLNVRNQNYEITAA